jgi:hypothetical protein
VVEARPDPTVQGDRAGIPMHKFTDKNHYNPCFWTAHWNPDYFRAVKRNLARPRARDAAVFALSVKANKVFQTTCKDVHYDKHLGVADITVEAAKDFCRRRRPEKYAAFEQRMKEHDYDVFMDFEEFFGGIEKLTPYQTLLKVIKTNTVSGVVDKSHLAHFVVWQNLRSHGVMNATLERDGKAGIHKFESFIGLRWMLENQDFMYRHVLPLTLSSWTLFQLEADTFPLSDSAVSIKQNNIMVALSPRHLLEIDLTAQAAGCLHRNRIDPPTLAEFRRRTLGNTFREIIFSNRKVLEDWRSDKVFQERVEIIRTMPSYEAVIEADARRE